MAMELEHSFTVPVPPDQAWDVLLDVKRVAPCMPGATVDEVSGDDVTGRLKVKVGPVSLTYKGTAKFAERDAAARSILVEASGKETRGAGTASATVRAALHPSGNGAAGGQETLVTLHTTMNVTGRPAQFGRGVLAEVGGKLVGQFADNLARQLTGGGPEAAAAAQDGAPAGQAPAAGAGPSQAAAQGQATGPAPTATWEAQRQDDAIDLLSVAGPSVLKRAIPAAGVAAVLALLVWRVRRFFRRRAA
jgi:carbon monoxide dehydrogenase subunit G